jgi:hypothetical protein
MKPLPLRDIHLPEPVAWWPPAPGWWFLGLALLLAVFLLGLWYWSAAMRLRRRALRELARLQQEYARHGDDGRLLRELSVLLRRLALSRCAPSDVACLQGSRWLDFLDRQLDHGETAFAEGIGRCLADGPYQVSPDYPVQPMLALARRWILAFTRRQVRCSS